MTAPLHTDDDVAEVFGMSVDEVRRRCRTGEFPHVRIGRKYRFEPADIAAIVAAHRREPAAVTSNPWGIRTRKARAS